MRYQRRFISWQKSKFLTQLIEFFPGEFGILQYFFQQALADIFAFVERDYRSAAVGMAHIDVAAALPDARKTQALQNAYDFDWFQGNQPTHAETSTSCRPTNLRGFVGWRSTSRQSWIASLIRSKRVGSVFAWVWQPLRAGTEPTKIPSSSSSIPRAPPDS